jgi:hypothetical protein
MNFRFDLIGASCSGLLTLLALTSRSISVMDDGRQVTNYNSARCVYALFLPVHAGVCSQLKNGSHASAMVDAAMTSSARIIDDGLSLSVNIGSSRLFKSCPVMSTSESESLSLSSSSSLVSDADSMSMSSMSKMGTNKLFVSTVSSAEVSSITSLDERNEAGVDADDADEHGDGNDDADTGGGAADDECGSENDEEVGDGVARLFFGAVIAGSVSVPLRLVSVTVRETGCCLAG